MEGSARSLAIVLCICATLAVAELAAFVAPATPATAAASPTVASSPAPKTTTGPIPPPAVTAPQASRTQAVVEGEVLLSGVPAYIWHHGCSPTAVGMVVGYYDSHGYDALVPGDASTQTAAADQMIASADDGSGARHYEDYSLPNDGWGALQPDKSEPPEGDEHASDCVADFIHTSWSAAGLHYGWSWIDHISPGFVGYVNHAAPDYQPDARYYSWNYNGYYPPEEWLTWGLLTAEIDAGRPMVFDVDTNTNGVVDHSVTAIGYRETYGYPEYAMYDTWYTAVRWAQFRPPSDSYNWGVGFGHSFRFAVTPKDTRPPTTTATGVDDAWHNAPVTVDLEATDDVSGIAFTEYRIDEAPTWNVGASFTIDAPADHGNDGVHTVLYRSTDKAGNVEPTNSAEVRIDTGVPTTESSADSLWHTSAVTIALTATDQLSGVAETLFSLDGKPWSAGDAVSVSTDGRHSLSYYSLDNAGNRESEKGAVVAVDTQPPMTSQTGGGGGWRNADATVRFSAVDAGCGVAGTEYRIDGDPWTGGNQLTLPAAADHSNDGDHAILYRSLDFLGHLEAAKTVHVRIDTTPPTTTDDADARWHNRAVVVTLTATDAASGVQGTGHGLDGGPWESGAAVAVAAPADHANDGLHTLVYSSVDNVGNGEATRTCGVRIDTRRPSTAAPYASSVRRGYWATLRFRVNDAPPNRGTARVAIRVRDSSGRVVKTLTVGTRSVNTLQTFRFRCWLPRRTYRFSVYATDAAGNKQATVASNTLTVR